MKALLIGGTGTISTAVSKKLLDDGWELCLFNRGSKNKTLPEGARIIQGDINDEAAAAKLLEGEFFDSVADFTVFTPEQAERDYRLFKDKARQYIFISSASAYQKPPVAPVISESTPLSNPHWLYSRNKIACEELLTARFREEGFPLTNSASKPYLRSGKRSPCPARR
jgi:nucleoside-diphosphate-sugar epimerase